MGLKLLEVKTKDGKELSEMATQGTGEKYGGAKRRNLGEEVT